MYTHIHLSHMYYCCSVAKLYLTFAPSWTAAHQASLSFSISRNLLKLMSVELMMPSNHLILCCPVFLLPSVFPSIRVFSSELALRISRQILFHCFFGNFLSSILFCSFTQQCLLLDVAPTGSIPCDSEL